MRYRFRCEPTAEQAGYLVHVFGAVRYVYNWGLRLRTDAYFRDGVSINYNQSSARLTQLKRTADHAWLNDVSSIPTQQALRHLQTAFANFFERRSAYPKFKRKEGTQSAEYTRSAFKYAEGVLTLAGLGRLRVRWSRPFASQPTTVTLTKDTAGRYHVTLVLDEPVTRLPAVRQAVGIDLGVTRLATLSTGEVIENPKPLLAATQRLARAQRQLARKQRGSHRRLDAKHHVAVLHARLADARMDWLHKVTTDLVHQFDTLCIEDLHVRGMTQNHSLARSLSDASLGTFRRLLTEKATRYGRDLRIVDRFYPSSKRCHVCGHTLDVLPLSVRTWSCPECGTTHDRDANAAQNILAAGLAVTARGGSVRRPTVRPKRRTTPRTVNPSENVIVHDAIRS